MAIKFYNSEFATDGTTASLLLGESAVVGRNGFVGSRLGIAIDGAGNNTLFVQGNVSGEQYGAVLGFTGIAAGSRVTVAVGGAIWGADIAVGLFGYDARVANHGTIASVGTAVYHGAAGAGLSYLYNDGLIEGGTGIYRTGTEAGLIHNTGTIRGLSAAIQQDDSVPQSGRVDVVNEGQIIGDVKGANRDDSYRSKGDGALVGTFFGGRGNDRFTSGDAAEVFDGGLGTDTANYGSRAGVVLFLDGFTEGEGGALDDLLIRVENVVGSRLGGDKIYGYAENNRLEGQGGADVLSGGAGNDTLVGGRGADNLTGGIGNDAFVFNSLSEAGDKIVDFSSNAAGNNDVYQFRGAAFGGLAVGALASTRFVSRADNLAQDLDDRFIFRTTDKTLWFDANGKTAGGLTMILDHVGLNSMNYQDIYII